MEPDAMTVNRVQHVGTKSVGRPIAVASKPLRNVGAFFAFSLEVLLAMFKPHHTFDIRLPSGKRVTAKMVKG
jgi:hypothetical protein